MSDAPAKRKWIPAEAYRQEKAVVWVRSAVTCPHKFLAFDRAKPQGDRSHLYQWKRGVRKNTLDTLLIWYHRPDCWFEFKSRGNKVNFDDPEDGQARMILALRDLGKFAGWGVTIIDLFHFYQSCGVPMAANAGYQALHYDGLVDSRIAKAEGLVPGAPKKARARTATPRFLAGKRLAAQMYKG